MGMAAATAPAAATMAAAAVVAIAVVAAAVAAAVASAVAVAVGVAVVIAVVAGCHPTKTRNSCHHHRTPLLPCPHPAVAPMVAVVAAKITMMVFLARARG